MSIMSFMHNLSFEGHHVSTCAIEGFGCMRLLEIVSYGISILRQILKCEVHNKDMVCYDMRV